MAQGLCWKSPASRVVGNEESLLEGGGPLPSEVGAVVPHVGGDLSSPQAQCLSCCLGS
jgi:hypothetical protein